MNTVPIRYVGKKPEETDHLYGTGLTWRGKHSVQQVPRDKAPLLLAHADVWRDARSPVLRKKDPIEPTQGTPLRYQEEDPGLSPMVPKVHLMPAHDLAVYALTEFNERLDPSLPEAQLRAEVVRLMNSR